MIDVFILLRKSTCSKKAHDQRVGIKRHRGLNFANWATSLWWRWSISSKFYKSISSSLPFYPK